VTDRIEREALRLFAEHGYEATTVADVARAADVAPRTVLRHFGTKDALVFRTSNVDLERLVELLAAEEVDGRDAYPRLRAALIAFSQYLSRDITIARTNAVRSDPLARSLVLSVQSRWRDGVAAELHREHPGVSLDDARLVAGAALDAYEQAVRDWADDPVAGALEVRAEGRLGRLAAMFGG
jgi:AcrR family transcriptional regulator